MIKRYFKIDIESVEKRLRPYQNIMLRNLWGMITKNEWIELQEGLSKIYSDNGEIRYGQEMNGYSCANCGETFCYTWAYGPGCSHDTFTNVGCANHGENHLYRTWMNTGELPGRVLGLARDILEIVGDVRTVAIEKAAEVVGKASRVPGAIIERGIETARSATEVLGRRIEDVLRLEC